MHPMLMLVTGRECLPEWEAIDWRSRLVQVAVDACAGGFNAVQVRERFVPADELLDLLKMLCQYLGAHVTVLLNGPVDIALEGRADGVHLPEAGLSVHEVRGILGPEAQIGRSVHSVDAAMDAEREGADYIVAGHIFATPSHPDSAPRGLSFLREACCAVQIPIVAIGGITPENAPFCRDVGASGIAVRSALLSAEKPGILAARYYRAMSGE